MPNKGINLAVTKNGKIQFTAVDGDTEVSFILDHTEAKKLRDRYQSVFSQVDHEQDNPPVKV